MKAAARTGKTVDRSEYGLNGYHRPRPEFGEDDSRPIWAEVTVPKVTRKHKKIGPDGVVHVTQFDAGDPYCKIKRIDFNPGSREQIADRLVIHHAWMPSDFTETGKAEINDEVLMKLKGEIPEAEAFAEIFFYNKLMGQLSDGKTSWLNKYDPDTGCIHGTINTGGTVSGRCSHSDPNLGQVPAVLDGKIDGKKVIFKGREGDYGWDCRSLFYTPSEIDGVAWKQIGADLKNIEARALAAVFAPYDDGELIHELTVKGTDLHDFNMRKTGITNRGVMKRVFFGCVYGAGDLKLGMTAEPYWSETRQRRLGGELRAAIYQGIPAFKKAVEAIQEEAKRGYLIGLDGRKLHVRAVYAALNLRLQHEAAIIAKKWFLLTEEALINAGGIHGWDGDFAMMAFVHDEIQTAIKAYYAEEGARLICEAATAAGEYFNYPCRVDAEAKIGKDWAECH